jgi:hypothetical protein
MDDIYLECCRRRCKSKHWRCELQDAPHHDEELRDLGVVAKVCPNCGHHEFYRVDQSRWPEKGSTSV